MRMNRISNAYSDVVNTLTEASIEVTVLTLNAIRFIDLKDEMQLQEALATARQLEPIENDYVVNRYADVLDFLIEHRLETNKANIHVFTFIDLNDKDRVKSALRNLEVV